MASKGLSNVFKLRDVVNLKDPAYGAKGDGAADDQVGIIAAIDAIAAGGGGICYAPPAHYKHSSSIVLKSGVSLMGEGYDTLFECTASNARQFENQNRTGPGITDENIGIFNLRAKNNGGPNTSEFAHNFDLRYIRNLKMDRVWCDDASGDGIYLRGNEGAELGVVYIGDVARQGISVTLGSGYRIEHVIGEGCNALNLLDIEPNSGDTIDGLTIGDVEVLSGTANAFNLFCDDDNAITNVTFRRIKSRTAFFRGCNRLKGDLLELTPTAAGTDALGMNRAYGVKISKIDILGSGVDARKINLSTVEDVDLGTVEVVGPGGNTTVGIDVVAATRLKIGRVNITEGGIFGTRIRNSSDVEIDSYVADGAGTYGFIIGSTTSNGNITIKGIRVTGYPTAGRIEGTSNIIHLEGDVSACATPLSISGTSFFLQIDKLRGYSSRQFVGSSAPAAGAWLRGDIVWQRQHTAGLPLGWVCTASGSPGTWVPFGAVQSANAYTVTNPATDRALNVSADTTAQVAAVLGTLIADLQAAGVLQ